MSIMVGSARHDEDGKYTGGEAGDQLQKSSTNDTAGEVSMQAMYKHSKGWYIVRPKDVDDANAVASAMKTLCNNANVGYDQGNRNGVVTNGVDSKVKTECDCSSGVRACVIKATGKDPGDFTTANEKTKLLATGLFEDAGEYESQTKTPVYNGDILVTKTKGHTVIVVSGNARTKTSTSTTTKTATTSASSAPTYKTGNVYKTQVDKLNVRKGAGTSYAKVTYGGLTTNAKQHAYGTGQLKKGTSVTCKGTKTVGNNVWMKIPSGWIAAYYNGKVYVK